MEKGGKHTLARLHETERQAKNIEEGQNQRRKEVEVGTPRYGRGPRACDCAPGTHDVFES